MTHEREASASGAEICFEREGIRLFAVERGQGEPVVLLHGGLADHRAVRPLADAIADRFRAIAPDLRGAGRSIFRGAISWDDCAGDLAALLDHLSVASAIVAGSSAGAAAALRFALRHPDRVRALGLLSPVHPGTDRGVPRAAAEAMERMNAFGQRALREGIEALLPIYDALPPPIRARARAMAASFDPASVAATTAFLASGAQPFDRLEELRALAMPVLVVAGSDPQHPSEVAALYAEHLPNARTVQAEPSEALARFCDAIVGLDTERASR